MELVCARTNDRVDSCCTLATKLGRPLTAAVVKLFQGVRVGQLQARIDIGPAEQSTVEQPLSAAILKIGAVARNKRGWEAPPVHVRVIVGPRSQRDQRSGITAVER